MYRWGTWCMLPLTIMLVSVVDPRQNYDRKYYGLTWKGHIYLGLGFLITSDGSYSSSLSARFLDTSCQKLTKNYISLSFSELHKILLQLSTDFFQFRSPVSSDEKWLILNFCSSPSFYWCLNFSLTLRGIQNFQIWQVLHNTCQCSHSRQHMVLYLTNFKLWIYYHVNYWVQVTIY